MRKMPRSCRTCDHLIAEDAKTCPSCGASEPWRSQAELDKQARRGQTSLLIWKLIGGAFLCAVVGLVVLIVYGPKDPVAACRQRFELLKEKRAAGTLTYEDLEHYNNTCASHDHTARYGPTPPPAPSAASPDSTARPSPTTKQATPIMPDPFAKYLRSQRPQQPTVVGNITVEDGFPYPRYLEEVYQQLRARWAKMGRAAPPRPVILSFTIARDGQVRDIDVSQSSGEPDYDNIMVGLVVEASPFSPVPSGESVRLRVRF
jgi:TonB family protein